MTNAIFFAKLEVLSTQQADSLHGFWSTSKCVNKVKEVITTNGGKILNENNEGKKHLAYAIDKQNYAVYYDFDVELPTESVGKVSNTLNITDEVIRYLLVAKEEQEEKEAKA